MEDEKLADKLLDRILMVLMPYDQIDVERIKAKLTVVLDDYQICPKQEALVVYTEGKNDYYLRKFLLAKAVAGRQERTLRQYKDEVGRALRGIGKDADTITADDIQVYLAKVLSRGGSKCYCDNIRLTPRKRSKPLSCKYITVSVPMSRLPANWAAVTGRKMLSS